jgi:uncharacterized membrane protein YjgN (DUF898 family)
MQTAASAFKTGEAQIFTFTGSGREYFGIWLVNFTLSVLTVGMYSAWAKVRRLQYFHRHTRVAGASFDYHGDPVAILKGRIVAVFLVGLYTVAGQASPLLGLAAFGVIALVLPWLLVRSLIFRLHNTSYRGLRFRFGGSTAEAYWVFLALPVLSLVTLLLLAPFCHHRIKRFQVRNSTFGATRFTCQAPLGQFYATYFGALGLLFALSLGATVLLGVIGLGLGPTESSKTRQLVFLLAIAATYGAITLSLRAFIEARLRSVVLTHTYLGDHRFFCEMKPSSLFFLTATNIVATLLTLGLFLPFAHVRLARYLTDAIFIVAGRSGFDDWAASEQRDAGAIGDESVGLFDFDIAI